MRSNVFRVSSQITKKGVNVCGLRLAVTCSAQIEDTVRNMVMRYGSRIWKLRVMQAEIKLTIRLAKLSLLNCFSVQPGSTQNRDLVVTARYRCCCAVMGKAYSTRVKLTVEIPIYN